MGVSRGLLVIVFLYATAEGIIAPIVPGLFTQMVGDYDESMKLQSIQMTISNLLAVITLPCVAFLCDKFHRLNVMILGIILSIIKYNVLYINGNNIYLYIALKLSTDWISTLYLATMEASHIYNSQHNRVTSNIVIIFNITSIGFIIGPVITSIYSTYVHSLQALFIAYSIIAALCIGVCLAMTRESQSSNLELPIIQEELVTSSPTTNYWFIIGVSLTIAVSSGLQSILQQYLLIELDFSPSDQSNYIIIETAGGLIIKSLVAISQINPFYAIHVGFIGLTLQAMFVYIASNTQYHISMSMMSATSGGFTSLIWLCIIAISRTNSDTSSWNSAFSKIQGISSCASAIGPIITTKLYFMYHDWVWVILASQSLIIHLCLILYCISR